MFTAKGTRADKGKKLRWEAEVACRGIGGKSVEVRASIFFFWTFWGL